MSKTGEATQATSGAGGPPPNAGLERTMKIVVGVLGLLILLGLGAVVARMVTLASGTGTPEAAGAAAGSAPSAAAPAITTGGAAQLIESQSLSLPRGAQVRALSLSGNRLAVHYDAPGGGGIVIQDLESGKTLSRVTLQVPGAP